MGFIGALIGYFAFGWFGALAGFFIGQSFGRGLQRSLLQGYQQHAGGSEVFFETAFLLLGHLAKADGRVSEAEIGQAEALMTKMSMSGDRRKQAITDFQLGSSAEFDLRQCLQSFAAAARFRPDLKRNLLVFLVEMAMADGELHAAEERVLRAVATHLHIDMRSFEQMMAMLKAQHSFAGGYQHAGVDALAEAYQALGVSEQASDKEIKRAYRKLMSQYHPDKMIAKGVPEDMLAMATEKTQEIQAAYDCIEKARKRDAA
jgi:DnaJ like chaperone protein